MNIRTKIFGQSGPAESPLVCVKSPKGARPDALLSIPVLRQQGRRTDTRVEDRFVLGGERTRVRRRGKAHDVQLINVCGGGAMVAAPFEPELWEQVELHLGENGTVGCTVLWIRPGRIGLEFAAETRLDCEEDEQAALIRQVIRRHFPEARLVPPMHLAEPVAEDHRHEPRHPFIWSGTLHCEYGSTSARLRNVSSAGAMIETAFELAPGMEPYLDLGEAGSIFGTIMWAAGDHSGVKFQQRFDLARLAHARPDIAKADALVRFGSSKH
jgi:hypothetical protein